MKIFSEEFDEPLVGKAVVGSSAYPHPERSIGIFDYFFLFCAGVDGDVYFHNFHSIVIPDWIGNPDNK